jgi:hypothetical protein
MKHKAPRRVPGRLALGLGLVGLLAVGLVALLAVGCTSSQTSGSSVRTTAQAQARPCGLLTAAEAQLILGSAVRPPRQAPLGPTCILESSAGSVLATISIQTGSIAQIQPRVRDLTTSTISGRSSYCGTLGQPTLWVPLDATRMLVIAAPCSSAQALAGKVLPRIA